MKIDQIAKDSDASIHTDSEGHVAIMQRHYDAEGIQVVRHAPDPSCFVPVASWEAATIHQITCWLC